jgi:hypothetical protein
MCPSLLALGIKRIKDRPQPPSTYTVAAMDSGTKDGEGGETNGTPQWRPHLEFQGDAQHHDAPQKKVLPLFTYVSRGTIRRSKSGRRSQFTIKGLFGWAFAVAFSAYKP